MVAKRKRRPLKRDSVIWCNRGWMPVYFGFCPSEKAWLREMRRLKAVGTPYPASAGRTTVFEPKNEEGEAKRCALVTIGEKWDGEKDPSCIVGIAAHESVHVFREMCEFIGEDKPSEEFEAYSIQNIAAQIYDAWRITRGPRS